MTTPETTPSREPLRPISSTRVVEASAAGRDSIPLFMTTEHFTLQTARAAANAEVSSRLQLYLTTLSSTIIALALAAQLSGLDVAFQAFALVLLPVVYFLGLATLGRIMQASAEWRIYGQGMNRIRHYFLEAGPDMERYFILPSTDDPWISLKAVGIPKSLTSGLVSAGSVIIMINSVVAGVFGWLASSIVVTGAVIPAVCASSAFLVSLVSAWMLADRAVRRSLESAPVEFPPE
jgi:hypothetical protein